MSRSSKTSLTIQWHEKISDIDREAWNALATPLQSPILEWEWLHQLEASGSIVAEKGWLPYHLAVWSGKRLLAAAPLYIKGHSTGEFVYDWLWADVANQLGVRYYPKLIGMSPATPSVGYRFLIAPEEDEEKLTGLLVAAIDRLCRNNNIAGCSFLFVDPQWQNGMKRFGFSSWMHQSYIWENRGYHSFDDYLAIFNKNQRRNIRRERKKMAESGIEIKSLNGEEVPRSYFSLMYKFYERTNAQFGPWAAKYLTKEFFEGLYANFRHRLLFTAAFGNGEENPLAMSFLLTKGDVLIGRYWGTFEKIDSLHFNACYYGPIEWAIVHGVRSFDPGVGSTHKIRRGFNAVGNYSLHRFYDSRLKTIMQTNIDRINQIEQQQINALNAGLPYSSNTPHPVPRPPGVT
jgi:predicted N-acyltransferase